MNNDNIMLKNLIVAVDTKWGISKNGKIPWRLKEDSNFFLDVTKREYIKNKKNAVIMGKNTWKSLPPSTRGLKDRISIVVSSTMTKDELNNDNISQSESYLVKTLDEGIALCSDINPGKVFIGGGMSIYKEAMERYQMDEIYLTKIDKDYDCDNTLPLNILSYLEKYKAHSEQTFTLLDQITKNNVNATFTKLYFDFKPKHFDINREEQSYLNLLENILKNGHFRKTRNSNTWSSFGKSLKFDL
jgi:dihydrofolate reductase